MRVPIALCLLAVVGPVKAGPLSVISYECEQLSAKKEPVSCKVEGRVDGPALTVTVLTSPSDSEETKKRASYLVESAIYRFTSLGGKWITEQTRLKDGRKIERSCARIKGNQNRVACHDWQLREWK